MPSYYDDAVEAIRRLLGRGGQSAPPPGDFYTRPPTRGRAGGATRGAVEANDLQRMLDAVEAQRMGLRNSPADVVNETFRARDAAGPIVAAAGAAAAAGLAGAVANKAKQSYDPPAAMDSTGGTAELADESRPAPVVQPTGPSQKSETAFTDKFKRQYTARENKREAAGEGGYDPRQQAQALIAQLNQKRMAAGGEVPEAPQMMDQINALLDKSNAMANVRTPAQAQKRSDASPGDPHAQAQSLLAQLNEMRRQAGGEVPQARQIMAEVSRLQSMGDQQRNAQTTARRY